MIGLLCLFAFNPDVADDALTSCGPVDSGLYSGCEWKGTGSPKNMKENSLTLTKCRFVSYTASGGSFGGVCRVESGTLTVTDTNFSKCRGNGPSCFYVGGGSAQIEQCEFSDNLPKVAGSFLPLPFPQDFGFGCVCIQNRKASDLGLSSFSFTKCCFFNNKDGCVGIAQYDSNNYLIAVNLTSCTFQDGTFSSSSGQQQSPGGQMFVDYGTVAFTGCTFTLTSSHTSPKEGWALVVKKSPTVTLDDCTFTKEKEDADVCSVLLATKLTMKKCSFEGNSLHIKASSKISVTIQECLQFSNARGDATENIEFVSGDEGVSPDDIIFYNGEACPVPPEPTTEEPDEPAGDTSVDGGEEPGPEPEPGASDSGPVAPTQKPTDDDDDDEDDDDGDDSKDGKNGLSGGEIAAIVIVVLIVIAAIVAVLLFFLVFRRRYGSKSSGTGEEATSEVTTTEEVVTGTGAVNQQYGGDFGLWDSEAPESDQGSKEQ